ncbi:MAG: DUF805 domain-containing protein [Campylobacterales bacterium]|nr:DUF805 domain-containing protein [Campylobacterales bacterium]
MKVMDVIKEYFLFSGVTGRKKYALQNIGLLVLCIATIAIATAIDGEIGSAIIVISILAFIWSLLSVTVNRIRDTKMSVRRGVVYLIFITPLVYIYLFFAKSVPQPEKVK